MAGAILTCAGRYNSDMRVWEGGPTFSDLVDAIREADQANKALCDAGRCPIYKVFKDHSHISQNYSVGTPDTSVSGPILEVLQQIK